ncbi:MAG: dihydrofolate reductase [Salibacteraceae bacterium]
MIVSLIVAKAKNNAIGKDNSLLWHLPADMKFFRETTTHHCIITGRKNYESIPEKYRPLKDRTNIVVTRNKDFFEEGIHVCHSVEEAIKLASTLEKVETFIIGGGQIYKEVIEKDLVSKMYITEVNEDFEADTFFPDFDTSQWKTESTKKLPINEKNKFEASIHTLINVSS